MKALFVDYEAFDGSTECEAIARTKLGLGENDFAIKVLGADVHQNEDGSWVHDTMAYPTEICDLAAIGDGDIVPGLKVGELADLAAAMEAKGSRCAIFIQ